MGLGVATAAGLAAWTEGLTPWLLVLATVAAVTLALGQRTSWPFAAAGAPALLLAGYAVLLRLAPLTGMGLAATGAVALTVTAVVPIALLARQGVLRVPHRRAVVVGALVIVVPVLLMAALGPVLGATGWGPTWAMKNDAVWNMVTARQLLGDGGVAAARPNSSPLTAGLIAMAAAVGRGGLAARELLGHDVRRAAELWLLVVHAACALAALVALRTTRGSTPTLRATAAVVTGLAAMSWYVVGFAFQFGFYNSSLALMLLLGAWLAWLESREAPVVAAVVLAAATIALLATWAPLAVIPLALAAVVLVRNVRDLVRNPSFRWAWWAGAIAAVGAYGALVTLGDLQREGAALAVDGGIQPVSSHHVAIVTIVTGLVLLLHALRERSAHRLIGAVTVVVASVAGIGYLVLQRTGAGANPWGYYPVKMAWSVCCLLLVLLLASAHSVLGPRRFARVEAVIRPARLESVLAGLCAAAVAGVLMIQVPMPGFRAVLPLAGVARGTGIAAGAARARDLFAVAEDGVPTIAARYHGRTTDKFLNAWLLQLESESSDDPIRHFSYVMDPESEAQVCSAIRTWGVPVTVRTTDPGLEAGLRAECSDARFTVVRG